MTTRISRTVSGTLTERAGQIVLCCWIKDSERIAEPAEIVAQAEQIRVVTVSSAASVFPLFSICPMTRPIAVRRDHNGRNTESTDCTEKHG